MHSEFPFLDIIKNTYPDTDESNIQIFNEGWDYVVCVVDQKHAFRFPRADNYEHKLPIQVAFLEAFSPLSPVAVPTLTLHDYHNLPYVTYDFIPGEQLTPAIFAKIAPDKRLQLAQQLGKFLTTIHSFPLEKARAMHIPEIDPLPFWTQWLEKTREKVYPYIATDDQTWIETLFGNFLVLIKNHPSSKRCTHSDIMPAHILLDPATHTLSGIIDFGDITIGDPAYDFTVFRMYGDQFLNDIYKSYHLPLDEYVERRRQFYAHRLPISTLAHTVKMQNEKEISKAKKALVEYIQNHPL